MKKFILSIGLLLCSLLGFAQIINQDADGSSSIVWKGTTTSLDLPDGLIKVSHVGTKGDTSGFLWGVDLQAKNKSGTGDLFKKGEFTPNTKLAVLLGRHKTSYDFTAEQLTINKKIKSVTSQWTAAIPKAERRYSELIESTIIGCQDTFPRENKAPIIRENILTTNVKNALKNIYYPKSLTEEFAFKLLNTLKCCSSCKSILPEVLELVDAVSKDADIQDLIRLQEELEELTIEKDRQVYNSRTILYGRLGLETLEFKYDLANGAPIIKNRFQDTLQYAGFIELGFTGQMGRDFFGLSAGLVRDNTFGSLSKSEYKFTQTDSTITQGIFQKTSTIKAYSGTYKKFWKYQFKFDFMRMFALKNSTKYFGLGPYFRVNAPTESEIGDPTVVFGWHASLFDSDNGKFLGGFYIQSDDLFEDVSDSFFKTIRFGFTAKFSLNTIFPPEVNKKMEAAKKS